MPSEKPSRTFHAVCAYWLSGPNRVPGRSPKALAPLDYRLLYSQRSLGTRSPICEYRPARRTDGNGFHFRADRTQESAVSTPGLLPSPGKWDESDLRTCSPSCLSDFPGRRRLRRCARRPPGASSWSTHYPHAYFAAANALVAACSFPATKAPLAAFSMRSATASGWETYTA